MGMGVTQVEQVEPTDELEDQIVAYCLGVLSPQEQTAFEARLKEPGVQARVDAYAETIEGLGVAAPVRPPPIALGERLMAQLDAPTAEARPTPAPRRWFNWLALTGWLAAAAMLLLTMGVGATAWRQQAELREFRAALQSPLVASMEAGDVAPQASGRFYLAPDSRQAVLLVGDLPPLPPDKVYQLWLVYPDGQTRDNGGTFRVDEKGYGSLLVNAPKPMNSYIRVGVTTEPRGGSPGPTSGRVVGATLANARPVER